MKRFLMPLFQNSFTRQWLGRYLTLLFLIIVFTSIQGWGKDIELTVIKNPTPTHIETDDLYTPLQLVKKFEEEIDDEHFFAKPMAIQPEPLTPGTAHSKVTNGKRFCQFNSNSFFFNAFAFQFTESLYSFSDFSRV